MPAPRLTVVLVVYRDQAYVEEAVSSVLEQSFGPIEMLAIDNASPDHGPEILDGLAKADGRLDVVRLDRTVGLGEARNIALDSAGGDYLWFLETTDLLTPGALAAVMTRLEETTPQVLVVDETRVGPSGRSKPGPNSRLIHAAAESETFTLDERPEGVRLAVDVWNKVLAREFLGTLGARFGSTAYGELRVTYPALFAADRIGSLDRVCYARRRPANAASVPSVHGTPFDVFAEYEEVFHFLESQPRAVASRRSLLPAAMVEHCLSLLEQVPERRAGEFFARLTNTYTSHIRDVDRLPTDRALRLQERLVRRGRYFPFRAMRWSLDQRRVTKERANRISGTGTKLAGGGRRKALQIHYRLQLRHTVEPDLAVFAAYWYRGYSCNPKAIFEKLRELAPWIRGIWVVNDAHRAAMPEGVDYVVAGTQDYYKVLARAKYFVNNVGFPEEIMKREGTIRVHTHHGTPLKTMGLDLRNALVAGRRMNVERQLRRCARWDYSVSQNAFSTLTWERAYPGPYETLEVGYPRNDSLVNASKDDVERIRDELGIERSQRAVLFAPTHREYLRRPDPVVDLRRLAERLGPDYVIMARAHYLDSGDSSVDAFRRAPGVLDVTHHPSIEELCLAADVLVTDYSSIMFDYAVLDRPLVVHAPDWEVYRTVRGTYFDLLAEPPGLVTASEDELVEAFTSEAAWSEESEQLRAAFRARFCYLDDGHAAERVIRSVWFAGEADLRPEPVLHGSPRAAEL
jgi:CDP-glycerol glycerophosphotransferase